MPLLFVFEEKEYVLGTQEEAVVGLATVATIPVALPGMDLRIRLYVRTKSMHNILDMTPPKRAEFEKQLRLFAQQHVPVKGASSRRVCYCRKMREKLIRVTERYRAQQAMEALA